MNKTAKKYYDALERVIEQGKKPIRSNVAKEAGSDPSSIKPNRSDWMDRLIEDIKAAEKRYLDEKKKSRATLQDKTSELVTENNNLKKKLNESYERQLHLIQKVRKMEMQIAELRKHRPSLEDLSANIPDYTKL